MKRSTWWFVAGTAAVLLGGVARAEEGQDASGEPVVQPAPEAQMDQGYTAGDPAHASVTEGAPARTAADPGGGGGDVRIQARPQTDPGASTPIGGDATELAAGNTGGRG